MLCIAVIFHPRNIPRTVFVPFTKFGATSLEFSFDHIMYKQIDGIAMRNPLRPVMANIFVGFYEQLLFPSANQRNCYVCYVDGTFCVFNSESDTEAFYVVLDGLHPVLCFICEWEGDYHFWICLYKDRVQRLLHLCTRNPCLRDYIFTEIRFVLDGIKLIL